MVVVAIRYDGDNDNDGGGIVVMMMTEMIVVVVTTKSVIVKCEKCLCFLKLKTKLTIFSWF